MTNTIAGAWRQSALCFLTFLIGVAVAVMWHKLSAFSGTPSALPPMTAETGIPPSSGSWNGVLTLFAIAALAVVAILVGFRLANTKPESSQAAIDNADVRLQRRPAIVTASTESTQANVEQVREEVERQLAELVGYVSRYLDTTTDQATAFATAQANLAGAGTVEQVQEVIKLLIANNTTARRNADELRSRLVDAQTESAKLQASLHQAEALATVDGLTNLPNRRRFQDCLEEQVAACHREHTPLCLVMADLDHFKAINDKFGHLSGDAVLKAFADLLSKGVRSTDVAARYGGEEFALILPKTPLGSASVVTESLRRAVAETSWSGATPKQRIGRVTASFGVAEIREDETVEALIDRADQKLYEAKRKGRNRVELDHTLTSD